MSRFYDAAGQRRSSKLIAQLHALIETATRANVSGVRWLRLAASAFVNVGAATSIATFFHNSPATTSSSTTSTTTTSTTTSTTTTEANSNIVQSSKRRQIACPVCDKRLHSDEAERHVNSHFTDDDNQSSTTTTTSSPTKQTNDNTVQPSITNFFNKNKS
jgi:hypothetical protein